VALRTRVAISSRCMKSRSNNEGGGIVGHGGRAGEVHLHPHAIGRGADPIGQLRQARQEQRMLRPEEEQERAAVDRPAAGGIHHGDRCLRPQVHDHPEPHRQRLLHA
jgi:hypothetical protein